MKQKIYLRKILTRFSINFDQKQMYENVSLLTQLKDKTVRSAITKVKGSLRLRVP